MKAGFGKERITPPLGTRMTGWIGRDNDPSGCREVHDDLYARALWLEQGRESVLMVGFDLCFFSREMADRLKGAIGRQTDLAPRQILLNTSHTHSGPCVDDWGDALYIPPNGLYMDEVERATIRAALQARKSLRDVSLSVGTTECDFMASRRRPDGHGSVGWAPYYGEGSRYREVPICLFADRSEEPVCLLVSASCHASTFPGFAISADYPGVAMAALDAELGQECSLFLQGCAGDSKVRSASDPEVFGTTLEDVTAAGSQLGERVITAARAGLRPVSPDPRAFALDVDWPLDELPGKAQLEELRSAEPAESLRHKWADRMLRRLERGEQLPTSIPVTMHGVQLAPDTRIVGLEGEAVAELGFLMRDFYKSGLVIPLGYTDGCQLYLPVSRMLQEGGYEVDSFFEYGWPAVLAGGIEENVSRGLERLRQAGIT